MNSALEQFHWLRPEWLWAAVPALLIVLLLARRRGAAQHWNKVIDPQLLPYLLDGQQKTASRWPLLLITAGLVAAVIAMAGPSWQKVNLPVHKRSEALVIALDLSISMYAEDNKPSRIKQAQFKLRDLLNARKEGQTALIAYAGEAFVVAPLTDDTGTLKNLLPTLEPSLMPMPGSNPKAAIEEAISLLAGAGEMGGRILLVTDGIESYQLPGLQEALAKSSAALSILALGSAQGAPIPAPNGGFMKDQTGSILVPKLEESTLRKLARGNDGRYQRARLDNKDIEALLEAGMESDLNAETESFDRQFDTWQDAGFWLVLPLLPAALLLFRRGYLLCLPLLMLLHAPHADAFEWRDLWRTPDQQGRDAMQQQDYETAADSFENPDWQAAAAYRAGDYETAAELYGQQNSADADYNRGNALARSGNLQQAIEAYDEVLQANPEHADASANKALLEELLQQQEQQQQNQDGEQNPEQDQDGEGQDGGEQQNPGEGEQQQQQDGSEQQSDEQSGEQQQGEDSQQSEGEQGEQSQQSAENQNGEQQENAEDQQAKSGDKEEGEQSAEQQAANAEEQQESLSEEEQAAMQQALAEAAENMDSEEQQALRQWLRKVPDDPGGLLRRKFNAQYQERLREGERVDQRDIAPY